MSSNAQNKLYTNNTEVKAMKVISGKHKIFLFEGTIFLAAFLAKSYLMAAISRVSSAPQLQARVLAITRMKHDG